MFKMKKDFLLATGMTILMGSIFVASAIHQGVLVKAETRTMPARVDSTFDGTIGIITEDDNLWFYDTKEFKKGDFIKVTFDTMNTETIEDDKIIKVEELSLVR